MRFLPQFMYQKDIVKLVDKLIMDDGYTSYNKVDDMAKESLTVMATNALGLDGYVAITDCDDLDVALRDLTRFITFSTTDNAICLANTLKRNAVAHFDEYFAELFDERFGLIAADRNREAGLEPIVDHVTGETRWVR